MLKTKTVIKSSSESISSLASQLGILLMSVAAVTGMLELQDHPTNRIIIPGQPNLAMANELNELNSPIRREREDSSPHYISYTVAQRTHSRAAKK